jgi:hypothetical protein
VTDAAWPLPAGNWTSSLKPPRCTIRFLLRGGGRFTIGDTHYVDGDALVPRETALRAMLLGYRSSTVITWKRRRRRAKASGSHLIFGDAKNSSESTTAERNFSRNSGLRSGDRHCERVRTLRPGFFASDILGGEAGGICSELPAVCFTRLGWPQTLWNPKPNDHQSR